MQKLVLDLRQNPGGLLDAAVGVADHFLDKGQMIVYTKGRTRRLGAGLHRARQAREARTCRWWCS